MTVLLNTGKMKPIRRLLRYNQTEVESKLWQRLKDRQLNGLRFVRQFSVGRYILDFYCPKLRLCIELDVGQHSKPEAKGYDKERTEYLNSLRIKVIRFWNSEVIENLEGILEVIQKTCKSAMSEPSLLLKRGQGELGNL